MAAGDVYARFDSYDFEKDQNFLKGLKVLHVNEEDSECMLKLKIFFYNKFVEPITYEGFHQWVKSQAPSSSQITETRGVLGSGNKCSSLLRNSEEDTITTNPMSEQFSEDVHDSIKDESATCQRACTCLTALDSGSSTSLSFAEVFRLIQKGEEVPGLQKLDIKPCHQPPTSSQMQRRPKPWEKTPSP